MSVGRIDRSMASRGSLAGLDASQAGRGEFDAALSGQKPQGAPSALPAPPPPPEFAAVASGPDVPEFLQILPLPHAPLREPLPWQAPGATRSVPDALRVLAGVDRLTIRRLLARFGGALDAGQLAYVLDSSAEVARGLILLLDEVGDGRVGAEELDPDSLEAALGLLEGDPDGESKGDQDA